mgnify:CR=1 FL=1
MTRTQFEDEVRSWWELRDFCYEINCDVMDEFIDDDARNESINEDLVDLARNNSWIEMLSILQGYDDESGYEYYIYDDYYGRYQGISDDEFYDYKQQVMDYADRYDAWDEEEEPEEPVDESVFTEENSVPVPDEDCVFDSLFNSVMVA